MTMQEHLHSAMRDCREPDCLDCAMDDAVDQWHEGAQANRLREHLGMTAEEYRWWLYDRAVPPLVAERWLKVRANGGDGRGAGGGLSGG